MTHPSPFTSLQTVRAGVLDVAFHAAGPHDGPPVLLMHGFPYDVHAYAEVAPRLAAAGCRVVVPFLRGFGPTRFVDDAVPRSGEQAALGADLLALMDALAIPRAVLAGYDWGGRAACVVAALWPERCAGLARDRRAVCRLLWQTWSPTWRFDDATFERSAAAFDNPDFVDVVIHSYRHRFGLVPGDPAVADIERRLAAQPPITVPVLTFDGADDGVRPPASAAEHSHRFSGPARTQWCRAWGTTCRRKCRKCSPLRCCRWWPRRAAAARRRLPEDSVQAGAGAGSDLNGRPSRGRGPAKGAGSGSNPLYFAGAMSQTPYYDPGSANVFFWVSVDDVLVGASIGKATLHYRYHPHSATDDPLSTYTQHAAEIDAAVRRRLAAGAREPVMLRDPDISAAR